MRSKSSCTCIPGILGLVPLLLVPAVSHAQQPTALPGIVVQGATLEAPRPRRTTPAPAAGEPGTPAPGPAAAGDGAPPDGEGSVAGVPAYTVGSAVTVVTGEEIRRQQIRHAGEALRSLPGVAVGRTGSVGGFTQVRIRGAEGNHTLVLIDGIEANNTADGEFDFSNLSAEEIERIEVIRGPMSGLYGANAVGGVVNIVTRQGRGPLAFTVRTEVGSMNTRDLFARLGGGSDWGHIAVSYHLRGTDGFNIAPVGDERDGARLGAFAVRGGVRLFQGATLDFTLRHTDKTADRDGFGGPAGTLGTAIDDLSGLEHRVLLAGSKLRWEMFGGFLTHELFANRNSTITEDVDRGPFASYTKNVSDTDKLGYLASVRLDTPRLMSTHTFSGRIEKEDERFTPYGTFGDGRERERGRNSYTGEWRGGFFDRLFLTAGIRRDDNDNFEDFTTWRAAASLVLREIGVRPHASVGTAVKLPTMFEQFGTSPFFLSNPGLQPEESFGWDAGVEFTFARGRAVLDVTYFRADLTNKIDGFAPAPFPFLATAENLPGESTREGVEVALRVKLAHNLTLGGAYTYLDARNPDGEREVRRPPHAGRADLAYEFAGGRGTARLAAIYNGRMEDIAFQMPFFFPSSRVILGDYWLVNAALSYRLHPGVEVFGRVENLLDKSYQEVFGFESAPIAVYGGVRLTFGGKDGLGAGRVE